MKPFLLLSTRPEDDAAAGELAAIAHFAELSDDQVRQIRVEAAPLPALELDDYSGVILGGGPFNVSDQDKSELQRRVEADLDRVVSEVLQHDFPFLGLCYGIGTVTRKLGGVVDRTHGEPTQSVAISLTDAGRDDPLLADLPTTFRAFVGHKEAVSVLPSSVELLAYGEACPVQMYRVGSNCYVTQFHPELDSAGLEARIRIYQHHGYFNPHEMDALITRGHSEPAHPQIGSILRRFAERYADNLTECRS